MAERTKMVVIEKYNPKWKDDFFQISKMIKNYIGDLITDIEHVGSTSVEGLPAKPIIDIDVVVEDIKLLPQIIERLESFEYIYQGECGVPGRHAFQREFEEDIKYHLYVCPKDGIGYIEHIALRNCLRQNNKLRNEYAQLKIDLSEKFKFDVDSYCEHKSPFIDKVLKKCGVR
ncbi:GrpB family protein [Bacillus cereus group sp. RP43]|uniref:GrpB family protein n=1 Tax=Bacillus cereus group sp. RP43 TaxID=3040260 RepID=UPI003399B2D9